MLKNKTIQETMTILKKLGIDKTLNLLDCQILQYNRKYFIKITKVNNKYNLDCITMNNNAIIA